MRLRFSCAIPVAFSLLALGACTSVPWSAQHHSSSDLGGTWRLSSLPGATPDDPAKYELTFRSRGRATFTLDCNHANGIWEAKPSSATGGGLTFGPLAMTRAMCPAGSLDTRIARDMSKVTSYNLQGATLSLTLKDGGVYSWTRITS